MNAFFSSPFRSVPTTALACALLFAAIAAALPARVNVSTAFTIAQQARQATPDYSYDGYYALRASELVVDTMLSWLSTPSVVKEIYREADLPATDEEISALSGRQFRGKKFSSQNLAVSFTAPDMETAAKLHAALSAVLPRRARTLVLSPAQETLFIVTASEPVMASSKISPAHGALSGAFVGAFLGLALAYFSERKKPRGRA